MDVLVDVNDKWRLFGLIRLLRLFGFIQILICF